MRAKLKMNRVEIGKCIQIGKKRTTNENSRINQRKQSPKTDYVNSH